MSAVRDYILVAVQMPQPGRAVDWMTRGGEEVGGVYSGFDWWQKGPNTVHTTEWVTAWRPAAEVVSDLARGPHPTAEATG